LGENHSSQPPSSPQEVKVFLLFLGVVLSFSFCDGGGTGPLSFVTGGLVIVFGLLLSMEGGSPLLFLLGGWYIGSDFPPLKKKKIFPQTPLVGALQEISFPQKWDLSPKQFRREKSSLFFFLGKEHSRRRILGWQSFPYLRNPGLFLEGTPQTQTKEGDFARRTVPRLYGGAPGQSKIFFQGRQASRQTPSLRPFPIAIRSLHRMLFLNGFPPFSPLPLDDIPAGSGVGWTPSVMIA